MIEYYWFDGKDIYFFIDACVTFLFLLALAVVFFRYKAEKSLLIGASVYAVSYICSNVAMQALEYLPAGKLIGPESYYLQWVMYEALTVIACFTIHYFRKLKHHDSVVVAYRLSSVNALACLYVHYLVEVLKVTEHIFFDMYFYIVNGTALIIALLFLLNVKGGFKSCSLNFRSS